MNAVKDIALLPRYEHASRHGHCIACIVYDEDVIWVCALPGSESELHLRMAPGVQAPWAHDYNYVSVIT